MKTIDLINQLNDSTKLSEWIETIFLSPYFESICQNLENMQLENSSYRIELEEFISPGQFDQICFSGLQNLNEEQIKALWECPQLLRSLRQQVLGSGRHYWAELARKNYLVTCGKTDLEDSAFYSKTDRFKMNSVVNSKVQVKTRHKLFKHNITVFVVLTLCMICFILFTKPQVAKTWGLGHPDVLALKQTSQNYLTLVADQLESDWKNQPQNSISELNETLNQLFDNCQVLQNRLELNIKQPQKGSLDIQTTHKLLVRCRIWEGKIKELQQELSKTDDIKALQLKSGKLIEQLILSLRKGLPDLPAKQT